MIYQALNFIMSQSIFQDLMSGEYHSLCEKSSMLYDSSNPQLSQEIILQKSMYIENGKWVKIYTPEKFYKVQREIRILNLDNTKQIEKKKLKKMYHFNNILTHIQNIQNDESNRSLMKHLISIKDIQGDQKKLKVAYEMVMPLKKFLKEHCKTVAKTKNILNLAINHYIAGIQSFEYFNIYDFDCNFENFSVKIESNQQYVFKHHDYQFCFLIKQSPNQKLDQINQQRISDVGFRKTFQPKHKLYEVLINNLIKHYKQFKKNPFELRKIHDIGMKLFFSQLSSTVKDLSKQFQRGQQLIEMLDLLDHFNVYQERQCFINKFNSSFNPAIIDQSAAQEQDYFQNQPSLSQSYLPFQKQVKLSTQDWQQINKKSIFLSNYFNNRKQKDKYLVMPIKHSLNKQPMTILTDEDRQQIYKIISSMQIQCKEGRQDNQLFKKITYLLRMQAQNYNFFDEPKSASLFNKNGQKNILQTSPPVNYKIFQKQRSLILQKPILEQIIQQRPLIEKVSQQVQQMPKPFQKQQIVEKPQEEEVYFQPDQKQSSMLEQFKSWFGIRAENQQYSKKLEELYNYLKQHGFKKDKHNRNLKIQDLFAKIEYPQKIIEIITMKYKSHSYLFKDVLRILSDKDIKQFHKYKSKILMNIIKEYLKEQFLLQNFFQIHVNKDKIPDKVIPKLKSILFKQLDSMMRNAKNKVELKFVKQWILDIFKMQYQSIIQQYQHKTKQEKMPLKTNIKRRIRSIRRLNGKSKSSTFYNSQSYDQQSDEEQPDDSNKSEDSQRSEDRAFQSSSESSQQMQGQEEDQYYEQQHYEQQHYEQKYYKQSE